MSKFLLTDAIQPVEDKVFKEGCCVKKHPDSRLFSLCLSKEKIFNVFLDSLDFIGGEKINVFVSNHQLGNRLFQIDDYYDMDIHSGHDCKDYIRRKMDLVVFKSIIINYEDFLLNDADIDVHTMHCSLRDGTACDLMYDNTINFWHYRRKATAKYENFLLESKIKRFDKLECPSDFDHWRKIHPKQEELFQSLISDLSAEPIDLEKLGRQ